MTAISNALLGSALLGIVLFSGMNSASASDNSSFDSIHEPAEPKRRPIDPDPGDPSDPAPAKSGAQAGTTKSLTTIRVSAHLRSANDTSFWNCIDSSGNRVPGNIEFRVERSGNTDTRFVVYPTKGYVGASGPNLAVSLGIVISDGASPIPGTYVSALSLTCDGNERLRRTFIFGYQIAPEINNRDGSRNFIWQFPTGVNPDPTNYPISLQLTATPQVPNATYTFKQFNTPFYTTTLIWPDASYGKSYQTTKSSIAGFAGGAEIPTSRDPAASMPNFTSVSVTVNNVESDPVYVAVLRPWRMISHRNPEDYATNGLYIYESRIYYQILDQYGNRLPSRIPINEKLFDQGTYDSPYDSGASSDKGSGWDNYYANGVANSTGPTVDPADWYDHMTTSEGLSLFPTPQSPQNPLSTTKVIHFTGSWQVGSAISGKGTQVQSNTYQFYIDHGRHTDIVSPTAVIAK